MAVYHIPGLSSDILDLTAHTWIEPGGLPDGRQGWRLCAVWYYDLDGSRCASRSWGVYARWESRRGVGGVEQNLPEFERQVQLGPELQDADDEAGMMLREMVALARYAPDEYRQLAGFRD